MIRRKKAEEVPDSAMTRQSRLLAGSNTVVEAEGWREKGVPGREKPTHEGWRVPGMPGEPSTLFGNPVFEPLNPVQRSLSQACEDSL